MRTTVAAVLFVAGAWALNAWGQTTTRVSVDSTGIQGNGESSGPAILVQGRYVVFTSLSSNLVPLDTNGVADIFVHDSQSGMTERVSVATDGSQGNHLSASAAISADGRYVVFESEATNLVLGDTNGWRDVFIHDRRADTTDRVSVDSAGAQGNSYSTSPSISSNGRFVAFCSQASNLVPGDTNAYGDVFIRDCVAGTTELASVTTGGVQGNAGSYDPQISADGRFVVFVSDATNLVPGDTNGHQDIFIHDRQSGTTERVSVGSSGMQGNGDSSEPSISADGRFVAFWSDANNLVSGDTNLSGDAFVHDRQTGTTERVSVDSGGLEGNGTSAWPAISGDGRYVAFLSQATNLVLGDTNLTWDNFVRDRLGGTTERVSVDSSGGQSNGGSNNPSISTDGRYVTFSSSANNLVVGDTNGYIDIFVRDRGLFTIAPFCFGDSTGTSCPCSNTGLLGHGCDNSVGTGGAILVGGGNALLSADTLVLTSSSERATAFSLFWQGDQEIAPRVFGDGLGCMGGHLKRLFAHTASGGAAVAPQGPDPSVSARSAAMGNPIAPGTVRVYHVFYRDPDPNFCPPPSGATFNTTNGLRVVWGG